jgi:hypothetical protein
MTAPILLALTLASGATAPLPKAPVRLLIPDPAAFDRALTGSYRSALSGAPDEGDRLAEAWRRSQVGSKLEEQWRLLAGDLTLSWSEIASLKPRVVGFALLAVGQLEAVLVVDTPLAVLPIELPAGSVRTDGGSTYHLVTRGAADDSANPDRRMGLAWARRGARLILATSERAMRLTLDEDAAGRSFTAPLPGIVSLELDLDALRQDLYFKREFLFGNGPESGTVRAALRVEGEKLIEVREGGGGAQKPAFLFDVPRAAAAAWEEDGSRLLATLRAWLLEPIPVLSDRPVPGLRQLPGVARDGTINPLLVSIERPLPRGPDGQGEEGELAAWRTLFQRQPVSGWGYLIGPDGERRVVFAWPRERQGDLVALCRATLVRRAGAVTLVDERDSQELRVGPDLPALALRRVGEFVWIGPSARALEGLPMPVPGGDVVRWARVDLEKVRAEATRWEKAEGPANPELSRPLSDRILGLLGWMPTVKVLEVERRTTEKGWSERVVFGR